MKTYRYKFIIFGVILCILFTVVTGIYAQDSENPQIPDDAVVTIVGGGGFSPNSGFPQNPDDIEPGPKIVGGGGLPIDNEKIYNGGGMDDFGTVYSVAGDLTITLKDVYITDNLTVITLALGTSHSASDHISSGAVYINGEQRSGGGSAGAGADEALGEPFDSTMTLVFYGRLFDSKLGVDWDSLRISFDGLVIAAYEGTDSGYIGVPEGYNWSFIFHNPDIRRYSNDDFSAPSDEKGIHTYGDQIEIELAGFSSDGDLNFDIIQKSDLLNLYGSHNALWINDQQQGGGGNSVSFDGDGNPEVDEDSKFVQTDHFLYQSGGEFVNPDSLAVWAQSVTFELTESGTPRTWSQSLGEDLFPMKLVQFYNID